MVYYNPYITGQYNQIYTLNNQVFFIAQLLPRHSDLSKALFTACWSPSREKPWTCESTVDTTYKSHRNIDPGCLQVVLNRNKSKNPKSVHQNHHSHPNRNHGGNTLRIWSLLKKENKRYLYQRTRARHFEDSEASSYRMDSAHWDTPSLYIDTYITFRGDFPWLCSAKITVHPKSNLLSHVSSNSNSRHPEWSQETHGQDIGSVSQLLPHTCFNIILTTNICSNLFDYRHVLLSQTPSLPGKKTA